MDIKTIQIITSIYNGYVFIYFYLKIDYCKGACNISINV